MPAREVRTFREGSLRWVEASAIVGNTWATGADVGTAQDTAAWAARSGLFGYVQAGANHTNTDNYATVTERGAPNHHKFQGYEVVETTFTVLYGITADYPSADFSVGPSSLGFVEDGPGRFNFEMRASAAEWHADSGLFWQFHNAAIISQAFTENEDGNELAFTIRSLSAVGPTASGYLS